MLESSAMARRPRRGRGILMMLAWLLLSILRFLGDGEGVEVAEGEKEKLLVCISCPLAESTVEFLSFWGFVYRMGRMGYYLESWSHKASRGVLEPIFIRVNKYIEVSRKMKVKPPPNPTKRCTSQKFQLH